MVPAASGVVLMTGGEVSRTTLWEMMLGLDSSRSRIGLVQAAAGLKSAGQRPCR